MKTLMFVIPFFALFICEQAFAFTTLDLRPEMLNINPPDKLLVINNEIYPKSIPARSNTSNPTSRNEDTIIINLKEAVITEGFPARSHDCLQRQIIYPEFAKQQHIEGVVAVTMLFNSDGNVEITDSFGSDPRLENYVHEQLYRLHLKDCAVQVNKPYNLRFAFRLY
jgi:hypothetical protein